jgi:hypothetical protein
LASDFKARFTDFNDRVNVDKLISPSSAEEVCEVMSWGADSADSVSSDSAETATDDDFDFDFE